MAITGGPTRGKEYENEKGESILRAQLNEPDGWLARNREEELNK
jgi:hypothetical protein